MRIHPLIYGFLVLGVFLGVIFAFQSAGIWSTSGKQDSQGRSVQPDTTDVSTIKGWMTLEQIVATYDVSLEEIILAFNLPADTSPSTAVKDLESESFSVAKLRDWLGTQAADEQPLPPGETAVHAPSPTPTTTPPPATQSPTAEEHTAEEYTVTGQTTFQNLLDWGMTQEAIERILGGPMPAASLVVKDYVLSQGLKFSTVKTDLQDEVDQVTNP